MPLHISIEVEEQFQFSEKCWLCENSIEAKVRDPDHLTGKYPGAACNKCNLNFPQVRSYFVPVVFHIFVDTTHLIFEDLLTGAETFQLLPKCMENNFAVQVGCLRFLDSYGFLPSTLD